MNGNRIFTDTNAIISLLNGNAYLNELAVKASWIGTSAICVVEFLSFPKLSDANEYYFSIFLQRVAIIGLNNSLTDLTAVAVIRKQHQLKLPDAVIASQALALGASLVTNDKHFSNIANLNVINFEQS